MRIAGSGAAGLLLAGALLACASATPLPEIVAAPRQFAGKEVLLSGIVLSPAVVNGIPTYVLEDRGARVLVEAAGALPGKGAVVRLRGKVIFREDTSTVDGASGVKIREIERK